MAFSRPVQGLITRLRTQPELAGFLSDPKAYAERAGINPESEDAKAVEYLAFVLTNNVKAASETVGSGSVELKWGIGASCCNHEALARYISR